MDYDAIFNDCHVNNKILLIPCIYRESVFCVPQYHK